MSRHEGVSCDSCLKGNFRGKRYKCLICYDYDLCSTCYEAGSTTTRHTTEHPMQCILTRSDYDLYFGGEALAIDQPQSFTCPYCGKLGFTEASLQEHVTTEHSDISFEVVCPICAAIPIGDPNLVTDDFAGHLTLEHRNPSRDLISFLDEPQSRHGVRRIPAPSSRSISSRARRSNMHFSSSGALASISPSSRENVDPIAELLSQLSGVRRNQGSTPSQLQHLQMQLQLERQQVRAARQQLERMPRRPAATQQVIAPVGNSPALGVNSSNMLSQDNNHNPSQLMLTRYLETHLSEAELEKAEEERADRSLFVRQLILSTLSEAGVGTPIKLRAELQTLLSSSSLSGSTKLGIGFDVSSAVNPPTTEGSNSASLTQQQTLPGNAQSLQKKQQQPEAADPEGGNEPQVGSHLPEVHSNLSQAGSTPHRPVLVPRQIQASPRRKSHRPISTDQAH